MFLPSKVLNPKRPHCVLECFVSCEDVSELLSGKQVTVCGVCYIIYLLTGIICMGFLAPSPM